MEGTPHCRAVVLSNGLDAALVPDLSDFRITDCSQPLMLSDLGEISHNASILRAAGEGVIGGIWFSLIDEVAVYAANDFEVTRCELAVAGGRRLAIAAATSLVLTQVNVYGNGAGGGQAATSGCAAGGSKAYSAGGGGGGAAAGAAGGTNSYNISGGGGAGGAVCDASHIPLRAGSSGGLGDGSPGTHNYYGLAGTPGAALQLAARGDVTLTGSNFYFGGGGGGPGTLQLPAGGGGSGGTVFIEAERVVLTNSAIYANGGNGGIPAGYGYAAAGVNGIGPSASAFSEGRGGTSQNGPGEGLYLINFNFPVGGGGGVGLVRVHGNTIDTTGTVTSPALISTNPDMR